MYFSNGALIRLQKIIRYPRITESPKARLDHRGRHLDSASLSVLSYVHDLRLSSIHSPMTCIEFDC